MSIAFIILANTINFCSKSFLFFSSLCILRIFLVTFTIYLCLLVFINITCFLYYNTVNQYCQYYYQPYNKCNEIALSYIYQNNNNNQNIKFSINIFIPLDLSRQHVIFVISWYYFLLFLCGYYFFSFLFFSFKFVWLFTIMSILVK